jgi:hypothetical protein
MANQPGLLARYSQSEVSPMEMLFNILVFLLFTFLWLAFIAALLFKRERISHLWQSIRSRHLLIQLALWLLFLPVMLGLWIWQILTAWQTLRGWPLIIQVGVWLLTLPVTLGLWIWQTAWPLWLRLVAVLGLSWVTVYVFFPRKIQEKPVRSPAQP